MSKSEKCHNPGEKEKKGVNVNSTTRWSQNRKKNRNIHVLHLVATAENLVPPHLSVIPAASGSIFKTGQWTRCSSLSVCLGTAHPVLLFIIL